MADDWGTKDVQPTEKEVQEVADEEPKRMSFEELKTPLDELSKICCLVYGADGSAKSGLVLSYIKNLKPGEKMVYIDLDGGALPLIKQYYEDRKDDIIYINPIVIGVNEIDYRATYKRIEDAVYNAKHTWKEKNIKAFVFDGISTALSFAEQQMRIEKNLTADGGVQMSYWKIRNRYFLQVLE